MKFTAIVSLALQACLPLVAKIELKKDYVLTLVGSGMGSRMNHFGHFETEIFLRHSDLDLTIRNLCDEGNTPGFRPHPGREQEGQYAFTGARELIHESLRAKTSPAGHFKTPDEWLSEIDPDVVLCFFGFNSSFDGPSQLGRFKRELDAYLKHLLALPLGKSSAQVVLISPTAVESIPGITDGREQNRNLGLSTRGMREIANDNKVPFIDCFSP